jgi:tRNA G18 (ribose-2'-O)-methylase SpoU
VGSIFRTADAAGIEKIYLCGITPAPLDVFGKPRRQLTKVSLGAEHYVKWEKVKATSKVINGFKKDGYKIFAIEQSKKSTPYYKLQTKNSRLRRRFGGQVKQETALILGNEIKGLPASILKRADKILEIPMRGKKESLNVAVAFGIVVFHLNLVK